MKLVGPLPILWFGFYLGWLGWAALNTVGTLATRHVRHPATIGPREFAGIVATFLFNCVALQTAFFPAAGIAWPQLLDVYRALCFWPVRP